MKNRKKSIFILFVFMLILSAGCTNKENENNSDYFIPIVSQREGIESSVSYETPNYGLTLCNTDKPEEGVTMSYAKTNASITNGFHFLVKWLALEDGICLEDVSVDLSRYQVEDNQWSDDGVFYAREIESILIKFDVMFETTEEDPGPTVLLVQIPIEKPKNYTISTYTNTDFIQSPLWYTVAYQLGTLIYENLSSADVNTIWAFSTENKQLHSLEYICYNCKSAIGDYLIETGSATKENIEKLLEENYHIEYAVEYQQEDVIVYSAIVNNIVDQNVLISVYQAYRDKSLIDTILFDETTGEMHSLSSNE